MRTFLRPGKILNLFLQGLIILAPIVITVWAVVSLFTFIDGILPNLLHVLFPDLVHLDALGSPEKIPGLGFLVVICIVLIVGYISHSFVIAKLVEWFDLILEKTPGVKIIYSTVKDLMEAFAGNKRKFNKAVLVSIESPEVWRIGFITQTDAQHFGLAEHVAVYVPHSYAFAGVLFFVKKDRIRVLDKISATDAMKFAISGGVADIVDGGMGEVEKHEKE
jgi:uncharacterized membrane protein